MAGVIRGHDGVLNIGGTPVAQLTSYTMDTTQDTADASHMDSNNRIFVPTLSSFSGSADFVFESDNQGTSQHEAIAELDILNVASPGTVSLTLYPEGAGTGYSQLEGSVIITGYSVTGSTDTTVTGSLTFQGTGGFTTTPQS